MSLHALATVLAIVLGHPHANPELLRYAAEAVERDDSPMFGGQDHELAVAITWAAHESHLVADPKPLSKDARAGASHGVLQQRLVLPLRDQFRAWLATLHKASKMCGGDEAGLRMISSGYCDRASDLVKSRLNEAYFAIELVKPDTP
jgi:hypothetical protein